MDLQKTLEQNKKSWNNNFKKYYGTTALPHYGCNIPLETELNLFGDISNKSFLEICCGSGHSLLYLAKNGAKNLWGVDISESQITVASDLLTQNDIEAKFMISSMENDPGLPHDYFDVVYSIYGLGWTLDLKTTLSNISNYLKKDGIFIFSWDHPFMHCVDEENEQLLFTGNYHDEDVYSFIKGNSEFTLINRKFSTYINSLYDSGFIVEKVIEENRGSNEAEDFTSNYYSKVKSNHFPLSFIIKARKM